MGRTNMGQCHRLMTAVGTSLPNMGQCRRQMTEAGISWPSTGQCRRQMTEAATSSAKFGFLTGEPPEEEIGLGVRL
jgi:hypothetical protein